MHLLSIKILVNKLMAGIDEKDLKETLIKETAADTNYVSDVLTECRACLYPGIRAMVGGQWLHQEPSLSNISRCFFPYR